MVSVDSRSAAETVALGARLGSFLEGGDFVALIGELGSGKTQFARGVASGVGVSAAVAVTSPTYTLMNIYDGRLPLYHFDLYRLLGGDEVADLGFDEYFYGTGVCLVEWAERLGGLLPEERLTVYFDYLDDTVRRISFEPSGERFDEIVKKLALP